MTWNLRMQIADAVRAVREQAPLVHGITGSTTRALVADGLLAAGARAMLTETREEAPIAVTVADALLVNLGSLSTDGMAGAEPAVAAARRHVLPWVLDPTAIGLAPVRTPLARALLEQAPAAVRGNASEVLTLGAGVGERHRHHGRGPDSTATTEEALATARAVARRTGAVVAVSGAVDVITDGHRVLRVSSGAHVLTRVSGTGCLLGALTAAHLGVSQLGSAASHASPFAAVVAATALLTVASERAGHLGPGSFRIALLDALDDVTPWEVAEGVAIAWE